MRTFLFAAALVALGNAAFAETQPADDLLPAITEVPETNLVEWTLVITSDIYRGGSVDFFPTPFVKTACLRAAEFGPGVFEDSVGGSDFGGVCVNTRTGEVAIPE